MHHTAVAIHPQPLVKNWQLSSKNFDLIIYKKIAFSENLVSLCG
jgi:hypothetical protein